MTDSTRPNQWLTTGVMLSEAKHLCPISILLAHKIGLRFFASLRMTA